jgi:HAE1 family hydrophobic/amphiphilic exporter-1
MESQVAQPIEEVVNTIEGIDELRSVNGSGNTFVVATFNLDRDIDVAAQDVRDRVATWCGSCRATWTRRRFPSPTRSTTGSLAHGFRQPFAPRTHRDRRQDHQDADRTLARRRRSGTSSAASNAPSTSGWMPTGSRPIKFPITAVRDAVDRQNANTPGGNVTTAARADLRTMGRLTSAKAFNDLVIATRNGSPIRVRDIGWAEDGTKEQRSSRGSTASPT